AIPASLVKRVPLCYTIYDFYANNLPHGRFEPLRRQKCLEYIVVHEMTHLLERYHNGRFKKLMDTFMPDWRIYKDILNRTYIRD
ncbi:MAG: M48 family metallopeptidase, partial [bacterium]